MQCKWACGCYWSSWQQHLGGWKNIWIMYFSIKKHEDCISLRFWEKCRNGESNQAITKSYRQNQEGRCCWILPANQPLGFFKWYVRVMSHGNNNLQALHEEDHAWHLLAPELGCTQRCTGCTLWACRLAKTCSTMPQMEAGSGQMKCPEDLNLVQRPKYWNKSVKK